MELINELITHDKIPQGIDIWLTLVNHKARKITLTKKMFVFKKFLQTIVNKSLNNW